MVGMMGTPAWSEQAEETAALRRARDRISRIVAGIPASCADDYADGMRHAIAVIDDEIARLQALGARR
jgi:hypothetical protein